MNVVEKTVETKPVKLSLGDVVFASAHGYFLTTETFDNCGARSYSLRGFSGDCGLTGYHNTLESLSKSVKSNWKVYPASEYQLVLEERK